MRLGSHRATIRREKRAQRARGEGRGARQTSNRHPIGPGVVRSYHVYGSLWPGRRRAQPSGRARGYAKSWLTSVRPQYYTTVLEATSKRPKTDASSGSGWPRRAVSRGFRLWL
eukprot:3670795-Prymnesium_polylepis.2